MLEILQHTPVWVYFTFLALIYLGVRGCFTREINLRQVLIFPVVFIFLSIITFYYYPQPLMTIPVWAVAAIAGAFTSRCLLDNQLIKLGKKANTLIIPGSVVTLLLLLSYFSLRYYLGYQAAVRGGIQALSTPQLILFFISSGFISGFFIARSWLLRKYYKSLRRPLA
ncbi:DUF6622 family protein [uncultured Cedecea sp.]|uniref:DUF6622 family protein n=1 Tax=uncultured Cedecea sp. TaxID=988762 RepID=UPI0026076F97|nr:DUF6622 family protein [uncultured Cedecea sp.]